MLISPTWPICFANLYCPQLLRKMQPSKPFPPSSIEGQRTLEDGLSLSIIEERWRIMIYMDFTCEMSMRHCPKYFGCQFLIKSFYSKHRSLLLSNLKYFCSNLYRRVNVLLKWIGSREYDHGLQEYNRMNCIYLPATTGTRFQRPETYAIVNGDAWEHIHLLWLVKNSAESIIQPGPPQGPDEALS